MYLALDTYPQPTYLTLWIVVIAAGGTGNTNIEYYQGRTVAYTKREAGDQILKQLAHDMPDLYEKGKELGGWRVTHADGISAAELERMFKERADLERTVERKEVTTKANELMQEILDTGDIGLLHKAIREGKLTKLESVYLHDKLTKRTL